MSLPRCGPSRHRSPGAPQAVADPQPGRSDHPLLAIDDQVASCFARLVDEQLRAGHKARRHDTWIAATALRHGAAVLTQDADFGMFGSVDVLRV